MTNWHTLCLMIVVMAGPAQAIGPHLLRGHAGQPLGVMDLNAASCSDAAKHCTTLVKSGRIVAIDRTRDGLIIGFSLRAPHAKATIPVDIGTDASRLQLFDWLRPGLAVDVRGVAADGRIKALSIIKSAARPLIGQTVMSAH